MRFRDALYFRLESCTEVKHDMTKAVKELIIVFLAGAGALAILWGLLHQVNTSMIPGQVMLVSRKMWSAVYLGGAMIVIGAALSFLLKPAK